MKIGFIGLGVMGRPMAHNLIRGGHSLAVNRVKPVSQFLVDAGARAASSARDAAVDVDIVILMLPDTPDVDETLFGNEGIAQVIAPGTLIIDMSSISPVATKEFAAKVRAVGGDYIDAPVSGGEVGAREATLTIMAGGSGPAFERALPLFTLLGKNISLVGENGDGQTAKVANQIIVGLTIEAVAEALLFAKRAGADPVKVREALMGGFAASRILEVHGDRMNKGTFDPGFRIRLHRKDLALALDAARLLDLALPNTAATAQLMSAALGQGDGDNDHSALIRTLEALSGTSS